LGENDLVTLVIMTIYDIKLPSRILDYFP
jgi:hypothetical protein